MPVKVLIIGAGLAGLALGQCLRRANIDFEIYERDRDDMTRAQGWAITLRECLPGLYKMLPKDMPPLEERVSIFKDLHSSDRQFAGLLSRGEGVSFGAPMYDTGELILQIHASGAEDIKHHWIRANRRDFREWLSQGLTVHWNKKFVRYEESEQTVRAFFSDGTSAEGNLLIAADGSHSRCRSQLMGAENSQSEQATCGALTANFRATQTEYRDLLLKDNAFLTATSPKYHFFLGACGFNSQDKTGDYYWSVTWDHAAEAEAKGWYPSIRGEPAKQMALELCKDLHPSLRQYIEKTEPKEMQDSGPQLIQWAPDVDRLPGKRVTLVGDALHTMTPFKGAGANTALLDVFDLAKLIIRSVEKGRDLQCVVPAYEEMAVPRGRSTKNLSRSTSLQPDPTHWARMMETIYAAGYQWVDIDEKGGCM